MDVVTAEVDEREEYSNDFEDEINEKSSEESKKEITKDDFSNNSSPQERKKSKFPAMQGCI